MGTVEEKRGALPISEVKNLAGSIDYQSNGIVSKAMVDKKSGTVTIFSFDKGEGLSEHSAPYDALLYVIEGEADITIGGKSYIVKGGEIILMPANIPHAVKSVEKFKMLLTMIRSE